MTDPMQTNKIKMQAVIVALKADHGDLETELFLRVGRSFVQKISNEFEKENDNVMSVLRH